MLIDNINLFSTFLAASTAAVLGAVVYFEDRKSISNKTFGILSFVFAIWSVLNYVLLVASEDSLLFWIRVLIVLTPPQILLMLFFVQHFPKKTIKVDKHYIVGIIVLAIMMMAISASPSFILDVTVVNGHIAPTTGALLPVFIGLVILYSLAIFFLIVRKFKNSTYVVKKQWFTMGTGFVTAYGLLIMLIVLRVFAFDDATYVSHAPIFILPLFVGVGYAILKRNLFNMKVIVTQAVVFIILSASLIDVFLSDRETTFFVSMTMVTIVIIFGAVVVRNVIREVQQLENMEAMGVKLKEADNLKSQFLSFASHQVKSPMTVVKGYSQLLLDESYGPLPEKANETIKKIYDTSDRLIALVNNLLDMRKLESGRAEYTFTETDLNEMLTRVFEGLRPLAEAKHLEYEFTPLVEKLSMKADSNKLGQVFQNLLDNAIKYTNRGSVKMDLKETKEIVQITVSDTGKGIPPELADRLFEQFSRAQDERTKGTGLGLYIAKNFVEAHNGTIHAKSRGPDSGSTFVVEFPRKNFTHNQSPK